MVVHWVVVVASLSISLGGCEVVLHCFGIVMVFWC